MLTTLHGVPADFRAIAKWQKWEPLCKAEIQTLRELQAKYDKFENQINELRPAATLAKKRAATEKYQADPTPENFKAMQKTHERDEQADRRLRAQITQVMREWRNREVTPVILPILLRTKDGLVKLLPWVDASDKEHATQVGLPYEPTARYRAIEKLISRYDQSVALCENPNIGPGSPKDYARDLLGTDI